MKISPRARIGRGSRLVPEHVYTPLVGAKDELVAKNVESQQMQAHLAPFRVNFHWTHIASDYFFIDAERPFAVAFTLPPLQRQFGFVSGLTGVRPDMGIDVEKPILDELVFSFDQGSEAAAVRDQFYIFPTSSSSEKQKGANGHSDQVGRLSFGATDVLSFKLSLSERKSILFRGGTTASKEYGIDNEVVSVDLPPDFFSGVTFRANPFVLTKIGKAINPFSTYVFSIAAPLLRGTMPELFLAGEDVYASGVTTNNTHALASVHVSLRFLYPLVARSTQAQMQNAPASNKVAPTITITPPAPGSIIKADDATSGVSVALATIDQRFHEKLVGGYELHGSPAPFDHLADDAAYEVIAVPLFQGRRSGGIFSDDVAGEPYVGTTLCDRRIIPLVGPLAIHHVIMCWSWLRWRPGYAWYLDPAAKKALNVPASATFTAHVGVGIGTGMRGDHFDYEKVASAILVGPDNAVSTWDNRLIDRISITPRANQAVRIVASADPRWDLELHQIPIGGATGAGYFGQGKPFFVCPSWSGPATRNNVLATAAPPETRGAEQWIEVRCHITDAGGLAVPVSDILVGYGGIWVYLICEKPLMA